MSQKVNNLSYTVEVAETLWQITDNLKGSVDAKTFSKYVLALFFYRLLSEDIVCHFIHQEISEIDKLIQIQIILSKGFFLPNGELFCNVLAKAKKEPSILDSLIFGIFCSPKAPHSPFGFCLFNTEEPRLPQLFLELYEGKILGFENLGKEPQERSKKLLEIMEAVALIPIFDLVKKTYKSDISVILEIQKEIDEVVKKKL